MLSIEAAAFPSKPPPFKYTETHPSSNITASSSSMEKSPEDGDCEFEFGCITPTSPSSDPNKGDSVSPADQFFLNGRLLPHAFPASSRATTRSNSTSSSMSGTTTTTSSARTSASDASERRAVQRRLATRTLSARERLTAQSGGQRQRWQLIAPVPVIGPGVSRRRRSSVDFGRLSPKKKERVVEDHQGVGFCQRILRSFVRSCKACHAMEGAAVEDDELGRHLQLK